ncbi:Coatomer subunit delta-like protein [Drosera capensis]
MESTTELDSESSGLLVLTDKWDDLLRRCADEKTKEKETREARLEEKIKMAELKEKWLNKNQARVARKIAQLKKRERAMDSRERSLELLEKKLEKRCVVTMDHKKNKGKCSNAKVEILLYKGNDEVPLDLSHADVRFNVTMNGRELQMFMNGCVKDDPENMLYDVITGLQISSNPAELVLHAMLGFYTTDVEDENMGVELSTVRRTCIMLLELLMHVNPPIKTHIKYQTTLLAFDWKQNIDVDGVDYLELVGFLLLVTAYELAYAFDGNVLAELAERAKQHPEYPVCLRNLDLLDKPSAMNTIAPPISSGKQLGNMERANSFLEPSSSLESKSASGLTTDPINVIVKEQIDVYIHRDGSLRSSYVRGYLSIHAVEKKDAYIQLQTHPDIDEEIYAISCSASGSGNRTCVDVTYEWSPLFDLGNVIISLPLQADQEGPDVIQIDREWRDNSRSFTLDWSIGVINGSHRSGSMKFIVPRGINTSELFPISARFRSTNTYSGMKCIARGTSALEEIQTEEYMLESAVYHLDGFVSSSATFIEEQCPTFAPIL